MRFAMDSSARSMLQAHPKCSWQLGLLVALVFMAASCGLPTKQQPFLDLSGTALDTLARINDDRGAILAADAGSTGYAILADTAPFIEWGTGSAEPLRFAGAGDGPGELKFPSGIALKGDTVVVWDPSSGRLSTFVAHGLVSTQTIPAGIGKIDRRKLANGYGNPGRIAVTSDGIVIAAYGRAVRQEFALWAMFLLRLRPDGALDTLHMDGPTVEQLGAFNKGRHEMVAVPLWAACGDAGLVTWDPVAGVLRRFGPSGGSERIDTIPASVVPFTDSLIRINLRYQLSGLLEGQPLPEPKLFDEMVESMLQQSQGPTSRFPDNTPAFVSMECDRTGAAWLQQFSLTESGSGMGRNWTLIDPTGAIRTVRFPPAFRVLRIAGATVWGEQKGEEGQVYVVKLELSNP